jgi:hypothetical protein
VYTLEGGVFFDNIILTHNLTVLDEFTAATWPPKRAREEQDVAAGRRDAEVPAALLRVSRLLGLDLQAALACFSSDPDRFNTDYALPLLLACAVLVVAAVVLRAAAQWTLGARQRRRHAGRAKGLGAKDEDVAGIIFPGEIQKTSAVSPALASRLAAESCRRARVLSSPLQYQSFSAPPTPSHTGARTIFEMADDALRVVD